MKKVLAIILSLVLSAAVLTGCGSSSKSTNSSSSKSYNGMVSSIDGKTITLNEVDMSNKEMPTDENGETKSMDDMKQNKEVPTNENGEKQTMGDMKNREMPTDENGETKSIEDMKGNGSFGGKEITTGAEHIITVTDSTKITVSENGEEKTGTISDVKANSMITVTVDSSDNALTIKVQNRGKMNGRNIEETTASQS